VAEITLSFTRNILDQPLCTTTFFPLFFSIKERVTEIKTSLETGELVCDPFYNFQAEIRKA